MSDEIVIEDGIPIPTRGLKGYAAILRSMAVGQSAVFPFPISAANPRYNRIMKDLGYKFTARTVDKTHCRIWRIA